MLTTVAVGVDEISDNPAAKIAAQEIAKKSLEGSGQAIGTRWTLDVGDLCEWMRECKGARKQPVAAAEACVGRSAKANKNGPGINFPGP